MTDFERYLKLKEMYGGIADEELKQYLHIVQVMSIEEKSYNKHQTELESWLKNIRKAMEQRKKEAQEEKPLTNFERIKATSIEEVTNMICYCMDNLSGYDQVLKWLYSEVQEE